MAKRSWKNERFPQLQQESGESYLDFVHRKSRGQELIQPRMLIFNLGYLREVEQSELQLALVAQYLVAKAKGDELWIHDARDEAQVIFRWGWIKENMPFLKKGKPYQPAKGKHPKSKFNKGKPYGKPPSRHSDEVSETTGMVKDARLLHDPNLPIYRSDAAECSTTSQSQTETRDPTLTVSIQGDPSILPEVLPSLLPSAHSLDRPDMSKVNEDNIVITRTFSSSKMGQPSETATGPSDDSVSSVSTRHHQSESVEVHSSAKPTKPMEKKIAPAHTNSNIVRNKPAGKEIAPGLKSSSNSMSSMGKKIAPGGNKPVGKKIAPRDTISTQYFYNSSSEVAGEMSPPRRRTVTLHEARPVKRPREEIDMKITVESTENDYNYYSSEDESRQRDWYQRPKKVPRRACPFPECSSTDRKLKRHVFQRHFPEIFVESSYWTDIDNQRANSLRALVKAALGNDATLDDAILYVNGFPDVMSLTTSHPNVESAMYDLCSSQGWPIPNTFTLYPVSSYATLLHWRCLCLLLNRLTLRQRRIFRYEGRISTSPRREESSGDEMIVLDECEGSESDIGNQSDVNNNVNMDLPKAYDSHFHLDRTAARLWGRKSSDASVEQLLDHSSGKPIYPVDLVGGVCVFSEPSRQPTLQRASDKWRIAVGAHPKHIEELTNARFDELKSLLRSPDVHALGEIGLDRTVPTKEWKNQDHVLERILSEVSMRSKPIILHLRGQDRYGADVHARGLCILRRKCSPSQPIHIHCFTGTADMVRDWSEAFPHAYFGFTAAARSFDADQVEALKAIPKDRLLLEMDSPYMPVRGESVNTPAFVGDVAIAIAKTLDMEVLDLLKLSVKNGRKLYGQ